eukprot:772327-Pelagomonas_calceolata.AAC.4
MVATSVLREIYLQLSVCACTRAYEKEQSSTREVHRGQQKAMAVLLEGMKQAPGAQPARSISATICNGLLPALQNSAPPSVGSARGYGMPVPLMRHHVPETKRQQGAGTVSSITILCTKKICGFAKPFLQRKFMSRKRE